MKYDQNKIKEKLSRLSNQIQQLQCLTSFSLLAMHTFKANWF